MQTSDLIAWLAQARRIAVEWLKAHVLIIDSAIQIVLVISALIIARIVGPKIARFLNSRHVASVKGGALGKVFEILATLAVPGVWLLILWFARAVALHVGWPSHILKVVASLTTAWIVIRFATSLIRDPVWSRFIAVTAWTLAALSTLGLFDATMQFLDGIAITLGGTRISLLLILKGIVSLAVMLWVAFAASGIFENRIRRAPNLTPSVQVLFGKLAKIVLISIAFLLALDAVGIDLTALTVFGGALGVGIGFGLQKNHRQPRQRGYLVVRQINQAR